MAKSKPTAQHKIIDAALKLAANHAWSSLTIPQIAATAKIPLKNVTALFSSTRDIVPAIVARFDDCVAGLASQSIDASDSPHDRLFELMMTRFDLLQNHRKAILNIMAAAKRSPALARIMMMTQWRAMQRMVDSAGLTSTPIPPTLIIPALLAIYGATLCTWQRDESTDMSKTMATLDRCLNFAGKCAETLFRTK